MCAFNCLDQSKCFDSIAWTNSNVFGWGVLVAEVWLLTRWCARRVTGMLTRWLCSSTTRWWCVFQQLFGKISMLDTGEHLLGTDSIQPLIQWKHLPAFGFWKVTPNCGCAQLRDHPVYIFWNFIFSVQKSKWQSVDAPKQGQESGLSCDILDPKKCNAVSRYDLCMKWRGVLHNILR